MDKYTVDLDKVLNDFEYSELTEQNSQNASTSLVNSPGYDNKSRCNYTESSLPYENLTYPKVTSTKHSINNVFHSLNEYLNSDIKDVDKPILSEIKEIETVVPSVSNSQTSIQHIFKSIDNANQLNLCAIEVNNIISSSTFVVDSPKIITSSDMLNDSKINLDIIDTKPSEAISGKSNLTYTKNNLFNKVNNTSDENETDARNYTIDDANDENDTKDVVIIDKNDIGSYKLNDSKNHEKTNGNIDLSRIYDSTIRSTSDTINNYRFEKKNNNVVESSSGENTDSFRNESKDKYNNITVSQIDDLLTVTETLKAENNNNIDDTILLPDEKYSDAEDAPEKTIVEASENVNNASEHPAIDVNAIPEQNDGDTNQEDATTSKNAEENPKTIAFEDLEVSDTEMENELAQLEMEYKQRLMESNAETDLDSSNNVVIVAEDAESTEINAEVDVAKGSDDSRAQFSTLRPSSLELNVDSVDSNHVKIGKGKRKTIWLKLKRFVMKR